MSTSSASATTRAGSDGGGGPPDTRCQRQPPGPGRPDSQPSDLRDRAVSAARAAFPAYTRSSKPERIALLQRVIEAHKARYDDIAKAISMEMGAPSCLATKAQA